MHSFNVGYNGKVYVYVTFPRLLHDCYPSKKGTFVPVKERDGIWNFVPDKLQRITMEEAEEWIKQFDSKHFPERADCIMAL